MGVLPLAEAMLAATCLPIEIERTQVNVGASIGVAIYSHHGTDAETLLLVEDEADLRKP